MIQIKLPVRAYKRLIYLAFASSFLCFLALHLSISYQRVHVPLETLVAVDGGGHTTATASGQLFRGLLQKSASALVEQQPSVLPSAASSPLLTSTSTAAIAENGTGESNKTRVVQSTRPDQVQQASPAVAPASSSLSSSLSAIFTSAISNLSKGDGDTHAAAESQSQSEQHHSPDDISQYFDIAPHVDHSPSLNEVQQLNELEQQEPHLAVSYWQKAKKYPKAKASSTGGSSKSCRVDFPSLYELEFNNVYWQKFSTANSSFYLYGAYYDDRWRGGPLPMVRVLGKYRDVVKSNHMEVNFNFD